jgi:hypothetical protein
MPRLVRTLPNLAADIGLFAPRGWRDVAQPDAFGAQL